MVEVKLEAVDPGVAAAKDLYVAVRIGDVQKLTRVSGEPRQFAFSEKVFGSRSYGKLEVFRHIGSCTFGTTASLMNAVQELSMDSGHGLDDLRFRVTCGTPLAESAGGSLSETASIGRSEAQVYLEKHQLQLRLADMMQSLLRERPADPVAFVSQCLQQNERIVKQSAPASAPEQLEACWRPFQSLPPAAWAALHARFARRSRPVFPPRSGGEKNSCLSDNVAPAPVARDVPPQAPSGLEPTSTAEMRSALDRAAASGLLQQILSEPRVKSVSLECVKPDSAAAVSAEVPEVLPKEPSAKVPAEDSLAEMRAALRGGLHAMGKALADTPLQDSPTDGCPPTSRPGTSQDGARLAGLPSETVAAQTALRAAAGDGRLWAFLESVPPAPASPRPLQALTLAAKTEARSSLALAAKDGRLTGFLSSLDEEAPKGCKYHRGWSVWGVRPESAEHAATQTPLPPDAELSRREACASLKLAAEDGSLAQFLIEAVGTKPQPAAQAAEAALSNKEFVKVCERARHVLCGAAADRRMAQILSSTSSAGGEA